MVNRLSTLAPECNGTPATEAKPTPHTQKGDAIRSAIRRNILGQSAMNQDAIQIKKTAEKLLQMLREFWNDYDSGFATLLWLQNGGITFEEIHDRSPWAKHGDSWSAKLCNDAAGFGWALEGFIRQFSECVLPRRVSEEVMREMLERLDRLNAACGDR
ncbi:hypothetical protein [Gemmata sp.]|uniref:hypothetical protein n=1 Tax=Gemmata sp. TaxID=1914242 RepID=UPI003F72D36D